MLRAGGLGAALETLSIAEGCPDETAEAAPQFLVDDDPHVAAAIRRVLDMITPRIQAIHLAFSLANVSPDDRLNAWLKIVENISGRLERGELPHLAELRFDEALGAVPSTMGLGSAMLGRARAYVRARLRLVELCEERRISWRFTSDR